ncbi:MAG: glycoside hydrolase family 2 TIM barrel-domain containing protein [Mangrovibacterium sp.]
MRKVLILILVLCTQLLYAQRQERTLEKGWKFQLGDINEAQSRDYNDSKWQRVQVPHDWAIYGSFDLQNDLQTVQVTQNLEKKASLKTGRTGGLPYVGVGWYRLHFDVQQGKTVNLLFDGAMSEAKVYVNGKEVGYWPFGYNAFHFDITDYLTKDGKGNVLAVRLENKPQSSRWYPGAGLYRNVHLIETDQVHVPIWGTQVTTPFVSDTLATVQIKTKIKGVDSGAVKLQTSIKNSNGELVAVKENVRAINHGMPIEQNILVEMPKLWSPEHPDLYVAETKVYVQDALVDTYETTFGIRSMQYIADKGFYLNGKPRKFQGVCNHHDLGPLGAAINQSALRHQLQLLKDMGCDAIRTSHNMPAPDLVSLCDEMGFMMQVEPFDEWDIAKCKNGYHRFFDEWAEKDLVNMLHNFRNNASVIMWSIGNEVPTQCSPDGYRVAKFLQDICHREDPTRLVTCGMDQVTCVLENGFASMLDIPGLNYRLNRYQEAYEKLPQSFILGSETVSTVSSRGAYKLPAVQKASVKYDDHQSSAYDLEYCHWSNLPDDDLAAAEDHDWHLGQFVWTGFDYLGEPSPYDVDSWPNHSSMFGIIDLASIPKDRYYLYRSVWNKKESTLHMLPHWNWEGHEGDTVPVFVYTSYPEAELFINGKSMGRCTKSDESNLERYRLMWYNTSYEPGELKVIAYDEDGKKVEEKMIRTAGKPHTLELTPNRKQMKGDGKDLIYVNVKVVDKDGHVCPHDGRLLNFKATGAANYRAAANGDPTCLDIFHEPRMHVFNGQLTVILQSNERLGDITLHVSAKGLKTAVLGLEASEELTD